MYVLYQIPLMTDYWPDCLKAAGSSWLKRMGAVWFSAIETEWPLD
jgi:hypothetical protein